MSDGRLLGSRPSAPARGVGLAAGALRVGGAIGRSYFRFRRDPIPFNKLLTSSIESSRAAGVQLHVSSLPSGRLGAEAYELVDWLCAAGQSYWQGLPLTPPDRWGSPYKSRSAFACWPRLLERPDAPVSAGEEADFRERQSFWI